MIKLIDRDANSPEEIKEFRSQSIQVLSCRNLESYLFDGEILRELAHSVDQGENADSLIAKKIESLQAQKKVRQSISKP